MNKLSILFLGIILVSHTFILTRLIFFPYPELFIYPYLKNQGLKPYSQILDQHFPGLLFMPINFNNLGMTTPDIARMWLIGVVLLTQILLFLVSKQILKSDKKALLINILYLIWQPFFEGWVLWIDTFLPLFLLPAFYFLYKFTKNPKSSWVFITGIFLGGAIVFKQVVFPLAFVVLLYILWKSRNIKVALYFSFGLLLPLVLMLGFLAKIGVLKDFLYWTIIFNLTVFAQYGRKTAPTFAHFTRVLIVFGSALPMLFSKQKEVIRLLLIFIIGALATTVSRFDFVHFQPALPFVLIATVLGFEVIMKNRILHWIIAVYGLIMIWWLSIFYKGHISDKVLFFDSQTYLLSSKVKDYTKPGEKIFVFGPAPHLYFLSNTLPAGDVFVFQFPWFLRVTEDRILDGIKKDQPKIIIADPNVEIEGLKIKAFAKKLFQYILQNYEIIDQVGTTSILRRKT